MKTFHVLLEDHKKLRSVMKEIEQVGKKDPENIDSVDVAFQDFKKLFSHHDDIEENVLYKRLLEVSQLRQLTLKAEQAHHAAKAILTELRILPYSSEDWIPKFLVLQDSILAHMQEEEEVMFVKAEQIMTKDALDDLKKELNEYEKENS